MNLPKALPNPSAERTFFPDEYDAMLVDGMIHPEVEFSEEARKHLKDMYGPQCHGCSKHFRLSELRQCTKCKRVLYCGRECQSLDWKSPRKHKKCCQQDLLDLATNNVLPNLNLNQTIAVFNTPSIKDFLKCVEAELEALELDICNTDKTAKDACQMTRANTQYQFIQYHRYGVDVGVESLIAAINMFPGVYTVHSCSGFHAGAWVKNPGGKETGWDFGSNVQYVSDDPRMLAKIQRLAHKGALGIAFEANFIDDGLADSIGKTAGFATIDCDLHEESQSAGSTSPPPTKCRTWVRSIDYPLEPFDMLDLRLWQKDDDDPPLERFRNNLVGNVGLAIEFVKNNDSLSLEEEESKELEALKQRGKALRRKLIIHNCSRFGIAT